MSWFGEILWNLWAGLSTVGSVLFALVGGLTLFLLLTLPHYVGQRRRRRLTEKALAAVPPAVREEVLAISRQLGGFPTAEAVLVASPGLRGPLAKLGVPAEELVDRLLAAEAPLDEEPDSLEAP